jgi:hypothetical protein
MTHATTTTHATSTLSSPPNNPSPSRPTTHESNRSSFRGFFSSLKHRVNDSLHHGRHIRAECFLLHAPRPIADDVRHMASPFPPPHHPIQSVHAFPYTAAKLAEATARITTHAHDAHTQALMSANHTHNFGETPKLDVEHPPVRSHIPVPDASHLHSYPATLEDEPDLCTSPPLQWAHGWPVEECVDNFYKKYPDPRIPEFVRADIVRDEIDPVTGIRRIQRIITVRNIAPWFMRKVCCMNDQSVMPRTVFHSFLLQFNTHLFAILC